MEPLRVAVAGLGTVGSEVINILASRKELISSRCNREIVPVAVSAQDRLIDRGVNLSGYEWYADAAEMARKANADVVVELIGGAEGIAKTVCETAIGAGRHVVTANKALLAMHGISLAKAAERQAVGLGYEASVAGGIPIIKALREGFAGNRIASIHGILNGTCNYILTMMRETGRDFDEVLLEAQELGYAEADPTFDVDGVDAAHKLALLASVAFGTEVNFDAVHVEGIRHISADDIEFAAELDFRIKLLGIANQTELGIEQRVYPCMVPMNAPLAHVEGVFNAVVAEGDMLGNIVLQGMGAGAGPTATAVISDIMDIARGIILPMFSIPSSQLKKLDPVSLDTRKGPYYVRLTVLDRPGVIADVSAAFRDEDVSVEALLQRGRSEEGSVPVVLTLHETVEHKMQRALARIAELDTVVEAPCMIRIEHL
ncbi:MAG: Homoserine dehydrogenase [Alphaproteobacteria bacterium MarineAlpha11_Bin1]|nr:MAG: Homoserine dehydrogenase [Alphaproteobacteria bacterium MarineAlpha11_Bin1]|tara:strand:- start:4019 stop:5308 length:1290 start_codon:yes stop_codon:yes gene_type:complete